MNVIPIKEVVNILALTQLEASPAHVGLAIH